ncbi:OLC1v1032130C1 [Oldenlandia corymbosa var. corymbosa]|uniref:OLC1v1032130C1 n=1 Tax=Oldenlandia corymbosa var. corymbosa TaxID=529605 RepID=A0AAV1CL14_OLDCO|nr:OLC1v1032130C1 [Oldenlandia corymbosa var. corymbosa]
MAKKIFTLILVLISFSLLGSVSQSQQPQNTTNDICNGIIISYTYTSGEQLDPTLLQSDPNQQPYKFESSLEVQNAGVEELKNWKVFVGFKHREYLVSASGAVLADGNFLPGNVSNGTIFSGSPVTDLKTAVETAGDRKQTTAVVNLVGTEFGVAPENSPMPSNISLVNDGFSCSQANMTQSKNVTKVCCIKSLNATSPNLTTDNSPLQDGDLSIMFDVISASPTYYWAQVTISNQNPIARLDHWQLTWEWMRGEFIYAMRGAYPAVVDTADCIFGPQSLYYKEMDFSVALSCDKRPTIIDLPLDKTNDTSLGLVPFCCRNGTILPTTLDENKSKSSFKMQVFKMEPDLSSSAINPPQNWKINSTSGPGYVCGQPIRVGASLFPHTQGLISEVAAVASWQIVCNITKAEQSSEKKPPNCCVSFSSFFNESVIPCNTCACGCSNPNQTNTCDATAPPLLLPPEMLLVPFDNRTKKAVAHARLLHDNVPNPLPCGDNCGVSINWHLLSDYKDGWTARMTIFNWGEQDIVDWSAAVEMDKVVPGFEKTYLFNGSILPNSHNTTLFFFGLPGKNYLLAEKDSDNPRKHPPIPGSMQSVIQFTKKYTPGVHVDRGDGFPTKVYFNGEECSLPTMLPISFGHGIKAASASISILLNLIILILLFQ